MVSASGIGIENRSVDSLAHEIDGYGKILDKESAAKKSTRGASGRRQSTGKRGESPLRAGASLQLSKDINQF